ncbi:MAG: hypothetical protein RLN75_00105 [Longimicrobiales bacterium]
MSSTDSSRRRVAAVFGLTLLEVIRAQDLPAEILQDEDPTRTLPRRLGLSDVVDRQIRQYREAVKKRRRMTDSEVMDLMRLVLRRPDSEEVFLRAGRSLAGTDGSGPGRLARTLPPSVAFGLARRRTRKRLKQLFGRRIGGFAPGPFALEGRALIFYQSDPGGDACFFVTGLCQAILEAAVGDDAKVVHAQCQSRGDTACRWTAAGEIRVRERDRENVGELLLGPEFETG